MSSHHTSSHQGGSHYASSHFGGLTVTLPPDRLADPAIQRDPFDLGYWRTRYGIVSESNLYTYAEAEQAVEDLGEYGHEINGDLAWLDEEIEAFIERQARDVPLQFHMEQQLEDLRLAREMVLEARKRQNDELAAIVAVLQMFY